MNGKRMYELLEKMNYVRVGGTEEEKKTAELLQAECASFGLEAKIEEFELEDGELGECYFEVTEPYQKSYEMRAYKRCASVEAEAEILYVEDALPANLRNAKDKILFINGGLGYDKYETFLKTGAKCIVMGSGSALDRVEDTDIRFGMFRSQMTEKFENRLSALNVRTKDLFEMLVKGAKKAKVKIESKDTTSTSRNVVAYIKGTEKPEEVIALTAHYDSVPDSPGIYDNAAGSAILMELARYFVANPPRYTLCLIWTGSEERGLLGSKAFVKDHEEELKNIQLAVNFDLAGNIAGHEFSIVTGPEELKGYLEVQAKEKGWAVSVSQDTYSSDGLPFADNGIPAVSIGRFGAPDMSFIHDRRDQIQFVSADAMEITAVRALDFVDRMDKAVMMPFERTMPDNMKTKIDEYFRRNKK